MYVINEHIKNDPVYKKNIQLNSDESKDKSRIMTYKKWKQN